LDGSIFELIGGGLIVGIIVAAPVGPIGTASLMQMTAGDHRSALAGMAGCVAAEVILIALAVLATNEVKAFLTDLPQLVYLGVSLILLALGLYFAFSNQMLQLGGVASFIVAFKVTLLSPNNLLALITLITTLGFAARLDSPLRASAFISGDLLGVVLCWAGILWLGWQLRRAVGAFMVITAISIMLRQI
jgi:putative LysE/RhtB family amino acid efflux pump